jgi:UDP-N-acetylglucosamine 2-epimerase (non-hydrolysing)
LLLVTRNCLRLTANLSSVTRYSLLFTKKVTRYWSLVVAYQRRTPITLKTNGDYLVECMEIVAERLPIVFPSHPRTMKNLKHFGLDSRLSQNKNVYVIHPLGYLEFLNLLLDATLVLTDSGGIQEEATFLQILCLTLRENTERPVTITLGTNYLVGTDPEKIVKTVFDILEGKKKREVFPHSGTDIQVIEF